MKSTVRRGIREKPDPKQTPPRQVRRVNPPRGRVRGDDSDNSIMSSDNEELDRPSFGGCPVDDAPTDRPCGIQQHSTLQQIAVAVKHFGCQHYKLMVCAAIGLLLVLVGAYKWLSVATPSPPEYAARFAAMRLAFPRQSAISWKMLNNSLYPRMTSKGPFVKPAVIGMVGPDEQVNDLQTRLVDLWNGACPIYLPAHLQEADDMRTHLFAFLEATRGRGERCVRIPHIDKIPPEVGPALHGFIDELHAVFTDMIYLFSFTLESPTRLTDMEAERAMVRSLRTSWVPIMGVERFDALIARLCVNVLAVP